MKISETCSCGASMKVDGEDAIKIVREWRRNHACRSNQEDHDEVSLIISDNSQVERSMGFQPISGLEIPARVTDPWEDDE